MGIQHLLLACLNFAEGPAVVMQGGDKLDLGKGHVLEFVMAPNLHWPDTMFTIDSKSGIMFTCDAFGMHYCTEEVRVHKPRCLIVNC